MRRTGLDWHVLTSAGIHPLVSVEPCAGTDAGVG